MVALVVPIFNGVPETRRCLSALAHSLVDSDARVILIDDASTDPAIGTLLDAMPDGWVQVRNQRNVGFVGSANLGIALAGRSDVILLNSDTQVTSGWLQAVTDCAASDQRIASITPLTNNGEIASIPEFCRPNPWPEQPELWARACRETPGYEYPSVPTAVGFCMFMRRACIDQIGAFDEQTFGRGYGEENDWCCRASDTGWIHVLCDSAYVAHQGGASFGPLGLKPGGRAMQALLARHPDYLDQVQRFIAADPMAQRRQRISQRYQELLQDSSCSS